MILYIDTEINHLYWEMVEIQVTIPRACYAKKHNLRLLSEKKGMRITRFW